jgi:hypothetical protein
MAGLERGLEVRGGCKFLFVDYFVARLAGVRPDILA